VFAFMGVRAGLTPLNRAFVFVRLLRFDGHEVGTKKGPTDEWISRTDKGSTPSPVHRAV